MNVALSFVVREEQPGDAAAVRRVLEAAFSTQAEAGLVEALRSEGDIVAALVACDGDRLIGSVVFSVLTLDGLRDARCVALAPLAVDPAYQRRGVGSALVRYGHDRLTRAGAALSLVLGDPGYYARFGYSTAEALAFNTPYDGPHLMALRLSDAAPRDGTVAYARAFSELS